MNVPINVTQGLGEKNHENKGSCSEFLIVLKFVLSLI